ncbi:hypothetical protein H1R20_g12645, partial [Candolleomyces eurysporus]
MSTESPSNGTPQGATARVEDVLLGGTVFFKVEETIFEAPQYRFTEYSEVFADMFRLPQVEDGRDAVNVEGRSKGHPIVLEGYKACDFAALIKVLYPTPKDMMTGAYTLTKDEWVGVLDLSTRWQMKMMREYAITKLSNLSLSSVEKVTLARAHKVAKWLKEGLSEIVTQEETLEPDELKSYLGLETAFRLVWIQIQSLRRAQVPSNTPITLKSLGCPGGHVEETIFEVPQYRFTEYSEVFADMFHMPQGAGDAEDVEGRRRDRPIVLEGYKAADFAAIVKVLYPAPKDMIAGSYNLTKDEWVGVLDLSTRWQMKMTREHAIVKLSDLSLSPFEKVTLARAHKVVKWLKEGLNEIVTQEEALKPDELKAHVGLETAFRLMWIQIQSLKRSQVASGPRITLGSLGCYNGHAVFTGPRNCKGCSREISIGDPEAMYVDPSSTGTFKYGNTGTEPGSIMSLANLRCKNCSSKPLSCTLYGSPNTNTDTVHVEEVFKEEIASYESWNK